MLTETGQRSRQHVPEWMRSDFFYFQCHCAARWLIRSPWITARAAALMASRAPPSPLPPPPLGTVTSGSAFWLTHPLSAVSMPIMCHAQGHSARINHSVSIKSNGTNERSISSFGFQFFALNLVVRQTCLDSSKVVVVGLSAFVRSGFEVKKEVEKCSGVWILVCGRGIAVLNQGLVCYVCFALDVD